MSSLYDFGMDYFDKISDNKASDLDKYVERLTRKMPYGGKRLQEAIASGLIDIERAADSEKKGLMGTLAGMESDKLDREERQEERDYNRPWIDKTRNRQEKEWGMYDQDWASNNAWQDETRDHTRNQWGREYDLWGQADEDRKDARKYQKRAWNAYGSGGGNGGGLGGFSILNPGAIASSGGFLGAANAGEKGKLVHHGPSFMTSGSGSASSNGGLAGMYGINQAVNGAFPRKRKQQYGGIGGGLGYGGGFDGGYGYGLGAGLAGSGMGSYGSLGGGLGGF